MRQVDKRKGMINQTLLSLPLLIGFSIVIFSIVPMLVLGSNSYVSIHDQLDGEVLVYMLRAKHLGEKTIPELMGGVSCNALVPASWGTLLFYVLFSSATAFNLNFAFVQIIAFVSMYCLLSTLNVNKWIAAFVSVLYSLLPFYSVYGLSIMGQALLWYGCIMLWKKKNWKSYAIAVLFPLFSSPVLVGFADCGVLLLVLLYCAINDRKRVARYLPFFLVFIAVYAVLYRDLLYEVLNKSFVSHRSEWVLTSISNIKETVKEIWYGGQPHAISNHKGFLVWILCVQFGGIVILPLMKRKGRKQVFFLVILVTTAYLIAVFYAMFHSSFIVDIRNQLGDSLKSFQFDRVYWLLPTIWYTALGLTVELIANPDFNMLKSCEKAKGKYLFIVCKIASIILCVVLLSSTAKNMWSQSVAKKNVDSIVGRQAVETSFDSFYSPELFQEIAEYIGRPQNEYKVASIALYPSVPLYNGFSCIDGYSNDYSLVYKHKFREIIAAELNKNDSIRQYFDEWGNRCYVFTDELGKRYYFTKEQQGKIRNLQLDIDAMKDMGCEYILSCVEIENSNDKDMKFLRMFENDTSPYKVYLYNLESKNETKATIQNNGCAKTDFSASMGNFNL